MAQKRLSMRMIKEILRLKWQCGRTHREVAAATWKSPGTVSHTVLRAKAAGYRKWEDIVDLDDDTLERKLYGVQAVPGAVRPLPDPVWMHLERKKPGVTLELLHLEYLDAHPTGLKYTAFCNVYRRWLSARRLTMRQNHIAGEKLFVDYSGKRAHIIDRKTGEWIPVELFVAVLGASNYTYAEATRTQKSRDFIASHMRTLEYIGGVPKALVPDQLKSGVIAACRYEPTAQRTYEEMARHYQTAILPARPRKPRDKAKVEVGVQVVQRWILARLRNERFFSLEALNERIAELLEELNDRPMRRYRASRRQLFEQIDRPELAPLPCERFTYAQWKSAKVNIDYHVEYDRHYYSVPYTLVSAVVEIRATAMTIEIIHKGKRVTSYVRSYVPGKHTTKPEHMPKSHRAHAEWTPSRMITWAQKLGPHTAHLVKSLLEQRRHPEQAYRSCLGIMRLEKRYGAERVDAACRRALIVSARSYKHVANILKNGLDKIPLPEQSPDQDTAVPEPHEYVRGSSYYQ